MHNDVKPQFLPQVSAPFVYVLKGLDDHGVEYENVNTPLSNLKPLQGLVDYDKVNDIIFNAENNGQPLKTVWTADNDEILDGHHNYAAGMKMNPEGSMSCIKLKANHKDAARILNKLMDLYSANQPAPDQGQSDSQSLGDMTPEELEAYGNSIVDKNTQDANTLSTQNGLHVREDEQGVAKDKKANKVTVAGFRKKPIKEKAASGNFFHLKPGDGFDKYEVDFDNLLDTNTLGIEMAMSNPVVELCEKWCDGGNLEQIAAENKIPVDKLASKLVAEKAKELGYDGIKYGDIILQAF